MKTLTTNTIGKENKLKTYRIENKTYYPSFYFVDGKSFDNTKKLTIDGISYYPKLINKTIIS